MILVLNVKRFLGEAGVLRFARKVFEGRGFRDEGLVRGKFSPRSIPSFVFFLFKYVLSLIKLGITLPLLRAISFGKKPGPKAPLIQENCIFSFWKSLSFRLTNVNLPENDLLPANLAQKKLNL
ncbi:hypothetical protein [Leptospira interrogans]|uniref:hypothetical protein n=1 Tax=Leptospira interrogans TaxID=173 RepID=UPI000774CEC8|nr:hypothetical protein [Leptospira interrogans]